jgi:hypothetical protein
MIWMLDNLRVFLIVKFFPFYKYSPIEYKLRHLRIFKTVRESETFTNRKLSENGNPSLRRSTVEKSWPLLAAAARRC